MLAFLLALVFFGAPSASVGSPSGPLTKVCFAAPLALTASAGPAGLLLGGFSFVFCWLCGGCRCLASPSGLLSPVPHAEAPSAVKSPVRPPSPSASDSEAPTAPIVLESNVEVPVNLPSSDPLALEGVSAVVSSFAKYLEFSLGSCGSFWDSQDLRARGSRGGNAPCFPTELDLEAYLTAWLASETPDVRMGLIPSLFTVKLVLPKDIIGTVFVLHNDQPHLGILRKIPSDSGSVSYVLELLPLRSHNFDSFNRHLDQALKNPWVQDKCNTWTWSRIDHLRTLQALVPEFHCNTVFLKLQQAVIRAIERERDHLAAFAKRMREQTSDQEVQSSLLVTQRSIIRRLQSLASALQEQNQRPSSSSSGPAATASRRLCPTGRVELGLSPYAVPLAVESCKSWTMKENLCEQEVSDSATVPLFYQGHYFAPYLALIDPQASPLVSQLPGYLQVQSIEGKPIFVQGHLPSGTTPLDTLKTLRVFQNASEIRSYFRLSMHQSSIPLTMNSLALRVRRLTELGVSQHAFLNKPKGESESRWTLLNLLLQGSYSEKPHGEFDELENDEYTSEEHARLAAGGNFVSLHRNSKFQISGTFYCFFRTPLE